MKKILCSILFLLVSFSAHAKPVKYTFDKDHTTILFFINHLGYSDKIGRFDDYDGYFIFDSEKPESSSVEVSIKPAGINTGSIALDKELQKSDWFNSAEFPEIKFKSSQIKITGKDTAEITGWAEMLGKSKPITMSVKFNKSEIHPYIKKPVSGFSATAEVKRSEFGMINGIPFVGDNVRMQIEVEGFEDENK